MTYTDDTKIKPAVVASTDPLPLFIGWNSDTHNKSCWVGQTWTTKSDGYMGQVKVIKKIALNYSLYPEMPKKTC